MESRTAGSILKLAGVRKCDELQRLLECKHGPPVQPEEKETYKGRGYYIWSKKEEKC